MGSWRMVCHACSGYMLTKNAFLSFIILLYVLLYYFNHRLGKYESYKMKWFRNLWSANDFHSFFILLLYASSFDIYVENVVGKCTHSCAISHPLHLIILLQLQVCYVQFTYMVPYEFQMFIFMLKNERKHVEIWNFICMLELHSYLSKLCSSLLCRLHIYRWIILITNLSSFLCLSQRSHPLNYGHHDRRWRSVIYQWRPKYKSLGKLLWHVESFLVLFWGLGVGGYSDLHKVCSNHILQLVRNKLVKIM